MSGIFTSFRDCGWAAWLCLLIGAAGMTAGVVGLVLLATRARKQAWAVGIVAIFLGMGSVGVGMIGRQMGLAKLEAALAGGVVEPELAARIRVVGTEEATQCVRIGTFTGALPLLMGIVAVGVGLLVRKKASA